MTKYPQWSRLGPATAIISAASVPITVAAAAMTSPHTDRSANARAVADADPNTRTLAPNTSRHQSG
ncbi:MAG: hypothetical protein WKF73_07610 [Nocardioidaceae bacterium]